MLNRRSRIARHLTKQAGVLDFARRHPALTLGTVGGLAAGGSVAYQDIKRGLKGLSPEYLAARRAGAPVPQVKSRYGYSALTERPDPEYDYRLRRWSGRKI